ncbi:MAG: transglutaminase-like domain-containing protein [Christensenellales bacterium]|jgi:hypothetical protein
MITNTQKTIRIISFIIVIGLITVILVACSSTAIRARGDDNVISISKESIPMSVPQASEIARAVFENGENINISPIEKGIITVNCNLIGKGIIGIRADVAVANKMKVKVSKEGIDVYYNIIPYKTIKIPMQMGNGRYVLELYENISGTNYRQFYHEELDINLSDPNSVFLYSNQVVDFENKGKTKELAVSLTKGAKTDAGKVKAIYEYVISHILYDYDKIYSIDTGYIPDVDVILTSSKGICYDYAAVMAAMLREAGVPAKLDKGYRSDNMNYHAWNEVWINGQWVTVDATFDATARQIGQVYTMEKDPDIYKVEKVF